jgi:hypothetical protein
MGSGQFWPHHVSRLGAHRCLGVMMMAMPMALVIRDNPPTGRFEAFYGDGTPAGHIGYRHVDLLMILLEVEPGPRGGESEVIDEMLAAVCDQLIARPLWMLPACQTVVEFLERHPGYREIVWDNVPDFPPPPPGLVERLGDLPGEEPVLPEQAAPSRRVGGSASAGRTEPPAETTSAGRTEPSAERSSAGGQQSRTLVIATVALGAVIVFSTIVALILLVTQSSDSVWTPILQDMLKTAFQALAVGALGGLAKLLLDRRKAKEAEADELRKAKEAKADELHDQQRRYIDTLVGVSHDVDNARSLISANRSVRTWTDVITGTIVPAKTRLRDIAHELTNWGESGVTVFSDRDKLDEELEVLGTYLSELIGEHADNKQRLAEKQREAEDEKGQARLQQLANIWDCLNELQQLGDFIRDGEGYGCFRQNYLNALTLMRSALRLVQE